MAPLSLRSWADVARHPLLPRVLAVTVIMASGQFAVFAFIAPYLLWLIGADANGRALALAWIGAFGLIGNLAVARFIDRLGSDRAAHLTLAAMLAGITLMPAGHASVALAAVAMTAWGLGIFGSNSAQQVRLAEIAPPLASASIALNTSAIYLGQAIGTAGGGLVYAHAGVGWLSWFGTALVAAAIAISVCVARRRKKLGPV